MGICNWAQFQFKGRMYKILTTNIVKSVNSFVRELEKFSITHLIDYFKNYCNNCFIIEKFG